MTEKELMDMFIQKRFNMLIDTFRKNQTGNSKKKDNQILQAELFINNLPNMERILVQNYIDQFSDYLALEEPYLYQQGFLDGIKIMRFLKIL